MISDDIHEKEKYTITAINMARNTARAEGKVVGYFYGVLIGFVAGAVLMWSL